MADQILDRNKTTRYSHDGGDWVDRTTGSFSPRLVAMSRSRTKLVIRATRRRHVASCGCRPINRP